MKRLSLLIFSVTLAMPLTHARAADAVKPKQAKEPAKAAPAEKAAPKPADKTAEGPGKYKKLRMGPDGPMPPDRSATLAAKKNLDEAKMRLTSALSATNIRSTATIEGGLWQDPEYRRAAYELRRAQSHYDAVRQPIFDALKNDDYYKDLQRRQNESQKLLSSMVFMGRGAFEWLMPHAVTAFDARQRMTREEILAMELDPSVESARLDMLRAAARLKSIRQKHVGTAVTPASIAGAREALAGARETVREAQVGYAQALASEAEYNRLREEYVAEALRTGAPPAGK